MKTESRFSFFMLGLPSLLLALAPALQAVDKLPPSDTEDIPEMLALKQIDVAFLCLNLPYTMTVEQAVRAVRTFKSRVAYPYHYRGSDLDKFKTLVGAGSAIPTVRRTSERVLRDVNGTLIRVNPREYMVPLGHIGLALGAVEGIQRITDGLLSP